MKKMYWLMLSLLLPAVAFAQTAFLDTKGTPMLMAKDNNSLTVGTAGTGTLNIRLASGTARIPISNPAAGTAATTIATSGTIDTTQFWQRITDAGAVTGVIMEDGLVHGQMVLISVDKDAVGSVTMAAEATSNACNGTAVVLTAGAGALFVYDATDTCWAMVSES